MSTTYGATGLGQTADLAHYDMLRSTAGSRKRFHQRRRECP
jgi:hypothetical protein